MVRRRIFAIATDAAACYLYRLHWPLTHLPTDEFEIIWGPPSDLPRSSIYNEPPWNVVVGQRIAGENSAWLEYCADPRLLAVYEIDDDIIDMDPANETPYAIFHPQRDGTIANIAAADVVTCSTPYLAAKIAARWNPRVVVLPNCLPAKWYDSPRRHMRGGPVVVGWAGSPFHAQDFVGLGEHLAKVSDPRVRWRTIGADYLSPHVPVSRSVGWTTNDHLLSVLDFDIGLAPLSGSEFNRSKSWAKLLEYGARGIPAICSWLGEDHAYNHWSAEGQDGCRPEEAPAILDAPSIVVSVHQLDFWPDAIGLLCDDDTRARMGAAARARAERYEISRQVHRWAEVYRRTPEAAQ